MFNLIKMNIYKTVRMKSFYVLAIVAALLSFWMGFFTNTLENAADEAETDSDVYVSEIAVTDENGAVVSVNAGGEVNEEPEDTVEMEHSLVAFFDDMSASGFFMILIGIGAAFIAVADYKNGFIKNYAGQAGSKGCCPIAKMPAIVIEIIFIFAVSMGALILGGKIFLDDFFIGSASALVKAVGMHTLTCTALSALVVFFSTLATSSTLGIVITIYLSMGISGTVVNLITSLLQKYLSVPESFDLRMYTIENYTKYITSGASTKLVVYGIIASIAYLAVSMAASFVVTKKRDI